MIYKIYTLYIYTQAFIYIQYIHIYIYYVYTYRLLSNSSKHFHLQPYFPKIQFLFCLLSLLALWGGGPMVDTEGRIF